MIDNLEKIKNFLHWYRDLYGNNLYSDQEFNRDAGIELPDYEASDAVSDHASRSEVYRPGNDIESYYHKIKGCQNCHLGKTRKNFVFGVGHPRSRIMFIGEAPGAEEDAQGKPFVGRAGKLLDKMLFAIGLKREDVYIANVLKCRPPNNRDPQPEEIAQCEPYLREQIRLIDPKVLVALGRVSGNMLTKESLSLRMLRSGSFTFNELPLIITYHPAALLRNPGWKAEAWIDLKKIRKMLEQNPL